MVWSSSWAKEEVRNRAQKTVYQRVVFKWDLREADESVIQTIRSAEPRQTAKCSRGNISSSQLGLYNNVRTVKHMETIGKRRGRIGAEGGIYDCPTQAEIRLEWAARQPRGESGVDGESTSKC
jgi:hypothetical protein